MANKCKVSVCIMTYNQVHYIRKCIQSIIDQETNFDFEIIVGDDGSTDGTADIVKELASKHPAIIKAILHEKNIGARDNYFSIHNIASGQYVAHLDGDDYALPGKLQIQADYLDKNKNISVCGHPVKIVTDADPDTDTWRTFPGFTEAHLSLRDIILIGMPCAHSSLMYRSSSRSIFSKNPDVLDLYLLIDNLKYGDFGLIGGTFGAYRISTNSITVQLGQQGINNYYWLMYSMSYNDFPKFKKEFFCVALLEAMASIKNRRRISPSHWSLLKSTICIPPFILMFKTHMIRKKNAKALVRSI